MTRNAFAQYYETIRALSIPCDHCNASGGTPCATPRGIPLTVPHLQRRQHVGESLPFEYHVCPYGCGRMFSRYSSVLRHRCPELAHERADRYIPAWRRLTVLAVWSVNIPTPADEEP